MEKRCIYFNKHIISATPCSPSRSTIYTGKNSNITTITDNTNNEWQHSLPDVSAGLKTMGTCFKNKKIMTRYIGKSHLDKDLDRTEIQLYKPTISTQIYEKI